MLSCFDVAKYFLALYDTPLFCEPLEAWTHGAVVRVLFEYYKKYGTGAIDYPNDVDFSIYDDETKSFLDEVYLEFGQFAACKLRNMTQEEYPWKLAAQTNTKISHKSNEGIF